MSQTKDARPRRAALYIRVSTEEQAKKGYSLPAQRENLEEFAKKNGYTVAGCYIDEGKSARKKYANRKEFMRMLEDVKAGRIDVILFIKLDRWFRSVADYYKIQEILDAHNVAWKTTQEHYDTETTNGRLYINIRLSVAQDESDRDSDRIKFVFDSKVARGEVITGSLPLGLTIRDKHVVPDPETADIAQTLFHHYRAHGSAGAAARHIQDTYGLFLQDHTVRRMLRNPLYKGAYRDNPSYCQPLIPPQEFDAIQKQLESRSIRRSPVGRVYLFSGLVRCACCGRGMSGSYSASGGREYYLYRCRGACVQHSCPHRRQMSEGRLEQWLLLQLAKELDRWELFWTVEPVQPRRSGPGQGTIRRRLERLKDLYVNELITLEQYQQDYSKYSLQLQQAGGASSPPPVPQLPEELLSGGFGSIYAALDRAHRRDFWYGIIREIRLDGDNQPRVIFRDQPY